MKFSFDLSGGFRLGRISFSDEQMQRIGQVQIDSQRARIEGGLTVQDMPAKPLSPAYAQQKRTMGAAPIRNMQLSGATLQAIEVTAAEQNEAVIGFASESAERKASLSNAIEPMFGISPHDRSTVLQAASNEFPQAIAASIERKP
jgi:hypothetical protein